MKTRESFPVGFLHYRAAIIAGLAFLVSFATVRATAHSALEYGEIIGIVSAASDHAPLRGATVQIEGLRRGALTAADGSFSIKSIPAGTYTIRVTYIGYQPEVRKVSVESASVVRLEFAMNAGIVELEELVVTGTLAAHKLKDTPVLTEVISEQDIRDIGSSNLSDILREEAGFSIDYTIGQTESANIHGLDKNHVLILVDGERISGKIDGGIDLAQIPVQQIKRIEVVKGPLSSIYGSEALGGVINIITKDAQTGPTVQAGVTAGSNGRQDYSLSLAQQLPNLFGERQNVSLALWTNWNKYFGVDYDTRDNFTETPEYDRKNATLKIAFSSGNAFTLDVRGSYYTDKMTWLAGNVQNYIRDESTNDKLGLTASARYILNDESFLQLVANYSGNDHGLQEFARSGARSLNSPSTETVRNYRLQWTTSLYQNSVFSVGTEYLYEDIVSDRIVSGSKDYASSVVFAENEWKIDWFVLSVGGRYSHNSVYGDFFSPKISVMAAPIDNLKLRLSYGRGFREPSLKELFIRFANTVGYVVEGEPGLKPERSNGLTAGIEYTPMASLWMRVNIYDNHVTNLIDYYTKSTNGDRVLLSYYNINEGITRGVDADITYEPMSELQFKLGYSFTHATDGNGNDLPFRIPHALNLKVAGTVFDTRISLFGHIYSEQKVLDDQTNRDIYSGNDEAKLATLPSYTVLNARVERQVFDIVNVFAGVTNITNYTRFPFGQVRPREFYAGINVIFQ